MHRWLRNAWFRIVGFTGVHVGQWLHPILYRRVGGSGVVGRPLGNLTILLTTTGARSGKPRIAPLWAYPDGEALVIVGTRGGTEEVPGWVHNLRAHPEATVQEGREVRQVRTREASGEEYERLWALVCAAYPGYAAYREWLSRHIPLFVLERTLR